MGTAESTLNSTSSQVPHVLFPLPSSLQSHISSHISQILLYLTISPLLIWTAANWWNHYRLWENRERRSNPRKAQIPKNRNFSFNLYLIVVYSSFFLLTQFSLLLLLAFLTLLLFCGWYLLLLMADNADSEISSWG